MEQVEHIGIAVKDLRQSILLFEKLFGDRCYKTEELKAQGVKTAFFKRGDTKIELLEDLKQQGTISRFIDQKGEGIHHIAFAVEDLKAEIKRLIEAGFIIVEPGPMPGADNKMVCFLHPKTTGGVLVELCMDRDKFLGIDF